MWWLAFKGSEQSWKQTWVVLFTPVLFYLSLECYPQLAVGFVWFLLPSRLLPAVALWMWWLAFKGSEQSWKQTWVVLFTPVLFYLSLECYPQPTVVSFLKLSALCQFAFWLDSGPELFQYTVFPCLFCAAFGPERRVFFAISATRPSWNLDCDRRGRPQGPKAPVVGVASTAVTPESKPCDEGLSDLFLAEHAFLRVVGCGTNKGHFACPKAKMSRLGTCNFREKEKSFNTQEMAWAGICWMQLRLRLF